MSTITLNFVVGAKGTFVIQDPFTGAFPVNTPAKITGVTTIGSLVNDGIDVLNTYYLPFGSTQAQYESDLTSGVQLITLSTDTGVTAKIPANAISVSPVMDGVDYYQFTAIASIGLIPANYDLTPLQNELRAVIKACIGLPSEIYLAVNGDARRMSYAKAQEIEALRKNAINNSNSLLLQNIDLKKQITELQAQLKSIGAYMVANGIGTSS